MVGWLVGSLFGWLVGWLRGLLEFLDLLPSLYLLASFLATMLIRLLVLLGLPDLLGLHSGWLACFAWLRRRLVEFLMFNLLSLHDLLDLPVGGLVLVRLNYAKL